ncbi:hypothetical protein ACWCQZ_43560 [Streptomyces sp. NPDC002285]
MNDGRTEKRYGMERECRSSACVESCTARYVLKKYVLSALASALFAFTSAAPVHGAETSTFGPSSHPVPFVHGYSSSGSYWKAMAEEFRTDGWPSSYLDQ